MSEAEQSRKGAVTAKRTYSGQRIRSGNIRGIRWTALMRYCGDGILEIDNSAAERALRGVDLGRRNYLFADANSSGERAAAIYTLAE